METYCNKKKLAPEISVSDSALCINSSNRKFTLFYPLNFSCTVVVYVPENFEFSEVFIKSTSGDTRFESDVSAKKEIRLNSTSGNILSEGGISSENVFMDATSGDIGVEKLNCTAGKVRTTSGRVKIGECTGLKTEFYATSGNISVKKFTGIGFDVKTTSGNINLELTGVPEKASSVECISGNINFSIPGKSKFSVTAFCTSGSFNDRFNGNRFTPHGNFTQHYNGGGTELKIRTSSGNINLNY